MKESWIVGFDPGETTGFALYKKSKLAESSHFSKDQRDRIVSKIKDLHWKAETERAKIIFVIEDFIGSGPRSGHMVYTMKLVGFLQFYCGDVLKHKVVMQAPQVRKAFVREAGCDVKNRHEKDACAHVLAYLHWNNPSGKKKCQAKQP